MTINTTTKIGGVITIICLIYVCVQIPVRNKYEGLKADIDYPLMVSKEMSNEDVDFLNEVKNTWVVHAQETNDKILMDVFKLTKFQPDVTGLISLYTHTPPSYSFFNLSRNKLESTRIATINVFVPGVCSEPICYSKDDAFVKLGHDMLLDYFENTPEGIRHTRYRHPDHGSDFE